MFESIQTDDAAARLRTAALPPLIAFLAYLLYVTLYPLLGRVPVALFWLMVLILFAGTLLGLIAIVRIVRRERIRGRAAAWLIAAVLVELLCVRTFLSMTVPWL